MLAPCPYVAGAIRQKQHNCASSQGEFVLCDLEHAAHIECLELTTDFRRFRWSLDCAGQISIAGLGADTHSLSGFSSAVKRVRVPPGELNGLVDVGDLDESLWVSCPRFGL